jgi:hypothetical protein
MARRKGSRNRSSLELELVQLGDTSNLSALSYEQLTRRWEAWTAPKPEVAAVPPPPKEAVEKTIIGVGEAEQIIKDTRRRFDIMARYFDPEETTKLIDRASLIPERIQESLRSKIFFASDLEAAKAIAKSALDKLFIHMLKLQGSKKVSGPNTPTNIRIRADKMEKWAKKLEERGRKEEAAQQHAKAEAVRRIKPTPPGSPWLS